MYDVCNILSYGSENRNMYVESKRSVEKACTNDKANGTKC